MSKLYVADRETGTFIEEVDSIEQGEKMIAVFEWDDKWSGDYEPDFYDIVDENHCSVMRG